MYLTWVCAVSILDLQSTAGQRLLRACGRSTDDISSIVLVEGPIANNTRIGGSAKESSQEVKSLLRHYVKSEAVLRIAAGLPNGGLALLAMFGFPFPLLVRDPVYDLVANNRYSILGKRSSCRLSDDRFVERFLV